MNATPPEMVPVSKYVWVTMGLFIAATFAVMIAEAIMEKSLSGLNFVGLLIAISHVAQSFATDHKRAPSKAEAKRYATRTVFYLAMFSAALIAATAFTTPSINNSDYWARMFIIAVFTLGTCYALARFLFVFVAQRAVK